MARNSSWAHLALIGVIAAGIADAALGQALTPNFKSDVFVGGSEGPLGTSNYRIPAMVVAPNGDLLAFIEARRSGADPGQAGNPIDMVMKRSTDGGVTWQGYSVLAADTFTDATPTVAFDYSDPRPVVNQQTGDIELLYVQWPDDCGQNCVPEGLGDDSSVLFQQSSSDNGLTWSAPVNINSQVKDPNWEALNSGPGIGIQLKYQDAAPARNGRLVLPSMRRDDPENNGGVSDIHPLPIYSDDDGATWQRANLPVDVQPGNETEIVELINGNLLLDARPSGGARRDRYLSTDGGENWTFIGLGDFNITTVDTAMVRHSARRDGDDRDRILYAGPAGSPAGSGNGRSNLALWTSYDEGQTFTNPVQVVEGYSAYSSIDILNDGTIGVVYEATGSTLVRYLNYSVPQLEGAEHDVHISHFEGFGNKIDPLLGGVGWSGGWQVSGNVSQELGGLEFEGMNVANDTHRMELTGADLTRSLGTATIDLDSDGSHYLSLLIRSDDDGVDSGSQEFIDVDFRADGSTPIALGVGSSENFVVNLSGVPAVASNSNAMMTGETYFLIAKLATSESGDDQVQLAWFDDVLDLPSDEASINWELTDATMLTGVVDAIRISGGSNAIWNVDALRIGASFDSVIFTDGMPPDVLGDLTGDGMVTVDDWIVFKANFSAETIGLTIAQQQDLGDFDANGRIEVSDYLDFRDIYDAFNGAGAFQSISTATPEPTAAGLLLLACCLWSYARRKP